MIDVRDIKKSFKLYNSPSDRLKEILLRKSFHMTHNALKGVSFSVGRGETLGVIGRNGAGKSTLLKILVGVVLPDSGSMHIDGRITGLLELGTGFNFELSGLENIYLNGALIGMDKEHIKTIEKDIIDFTELGDFISKPIKSYSSGMVMRLAFSIAIHSEPMCFVVDEALSVGDAYFQQKCMKKIKEFREKGGSIIFVSHDMGAVKMLCDRAVLLEGGEVVYEGYPEDVVNKYNFIIARSEEESEGRLVRVAHDASYGNFQIEITDVGIKGEQSEADMLTSGEKAVVSVTMKSKVDFDDISVGMLIRDRFGQDIYGTNTYLAGYPLSVSKGETKTVKFDFFMNINEGKYTLTVAVHTGSTHVFDCFHWMDSVCQFEVAGYRGSKFTGVAKLDTEVSSSSFITE